MRSTIRLVSRRGLGIGLLTGCLWGGVLGCASERPPAHSSRDPAAASVREDALSPRQERRRTDDTLPSRAKEPRRDDPSEEVRLEGEYGGRRAVAVLEGEASYYGDSLAGHHTANGERYDPRAFTAAHRTLPFGTIVRVVRTDTHAVVYVRVTDRGPFGSSRRILDLSRAAAERLHMIRSGVAKVRAEIVEYGPERRRRR